MKKPEKIVYDSQRYIGVGERDWVAGYNRACTDWQAYVIENYVMKSEIREAIKNMFAVRRIKKEKDQYAHDLLTIKAMLE